MQWVRKWGDMFEKLSLTKFNLTIVANSCSRRFPCCVLKILSWIKNENQKQISWAGQSTNLALDYKPLASPHPRSPFPWTNLCAALIRLHQKRCNFDIFPHPPSSTQPNASARRSSFFSSLSHWNHEVIFPFLEMQLQMNRICVSPPTHSIGPNVEWPESRNWLLLQH